MLDYEKQIFLEILNEDGLVVAAKGIGLENVLVTLLSTYSDPGNLVLVLGTDGKHQEWLVSSLIASGGSEPKVVSSELGVSERSTAYLDGGIWFVPTRILIVDMIKKRIPIELITGIVVWRAHGILLRHQDSFVLRLFRQGNQTGFIKAFSNHAPGFRGGLSKVEQILKALFLRKLFLWPRYHALIKNCLSQIKPTVEEFHLEMTGNMLQLQNALLDLVKVTIQEMKRLNPLLDTEEVTVENAICDSFHKVLHAQLDPVWHALSERTKLLLTDLKLFHFLIRAMLTYDSVTFYHLIRSQRSSDQVRKGSGWHVLPTAEILFNAAAKRVQNGPEDAPDPEPSPKWIAVVEVIAEIHRKIRHGGQINDNVEDELIDMFEHKKSTSTNNETGIILILVKEERTCSQIHRFLKLGAVKLLKSQYDKLFSKRGKESGKNSEENNSDDLEDENMDDECGNLTLSLTQAAFAQLNSNDRTSLAGCFEDSFQAPEKNDLSSEHIEDEEILNPPTIVLKAWKDDQVQLPQYIEKLKPRWVIMYDADITTVRQLELYQRNNPTLPLTVFFLVYGGTVEEQAYLTSLRREKEAFDFLIEEKGRLVIPEDRSDSAELSRDASKASDLANSRQGGITGPSEPGKVIVDMREFRSELPALIHARGIDIEPLTITVGDYILTPDICLERKSISDLIQSINSGRLYNQIQAMTRHYSRPMLLIEFDKDKPFDLQDRYYLSTDSSSEQLVTKLQLLTLHFPQLRLIWSPSPQATAVLFEELKEGHPQPDPNTALGIGLDESPCDLLFNPGPQAFLQCLPGVTTKNLSALLRNGGSIDDIRKRTSDDLTKILENSQLADSLYSTFHSVLERDPDDGSFRKPMRPGAAKGLQRKRFHKR